MKDKNTDERLWWAVLAYADTICALESDRDGEKAMWAMRVGGRARTKLREMGANLDRAFDDGQEMFYKLMYEVEQEEKAFDKRLDAAIKLLDKLKSNV
jgi:hypothetical protein